MYLLNVVVLNSRTLGKLYMYIFWLYMYIHTYIHTYIQNRVLWSSALNQSEIGMLPGIAGLKGPFTGIGARGFRSHERALQKGCGVQ